MADELTNLQNAKPTQYRKLAELVDYNVLRAASLGELDKVRTILHRDVYMICLIAVDDHE